MRSAKHGVVRDGNGTVVVGATISVYLAGTLTPANVYSTLASVTQISSVTSDSSGHYVFYVDTADYATTQKFKIIGTHPSFPSFTLDDITLYPVDIINSSALGSVPERTIAGSGTLNPLTDGIVYLDISAGDTTLNLCPIASVPASNRIIWVQAIGSLDYVGHVVPDGAETIQTGGSINLVLNEWVGLKVQSATNWQYV